MWHETSEDIRVTRPTRSGRGMATRASARGGLRSRPRRPGRRALRYRPARRAPAGRPGLPARARRAHPRASGRARSAVLSRGVMGQAVGVDRPTAPAADGRDAESLAWVEALSGTGHGREDAVERLHELLLRASAFEIARRHDAGGEGHG